MLFPTVDYLLFLILVVGVHWAVPARHRLWVLGGASVIFYASWNLAYLPLLFGVTAVAWAAGVMLSKRTAQRKHQAESVKKRAVGDRGILSDTAVASNPKEPATDKLSGGALLCALFLPLFVFKYWDWTIENLTTVFGWIGLELEVISFRQDLGWLLPVGISFFTFQAVAYVVDVWRSGESERSFFRFFTFLAFFPQLIAGPIVRRKELLPQLKRPPFLESGAVSEALWRITKGMLKKLLIADVIRASMVDSVFQDPLSYTGLELWVALYAYTIQIYYDFSAYTDIAIGSALLFGIRLPENFRRPYQATTVAEFWRRWHITLSNWVRDYIYYPLGGARTDKTWKVYRNIILTMVVIGIWHGASWNFVIYGCLHGSAVSLNRFFRQRHGRRPGEPLPGVWAWSWRFFLTFNFVVWARVLFGTANLVDARDFLRGMLDLNLTLSDVRFPPEAWVVLFLGYAWHFTPQRWTQSLGSVFRQAPPAAQAVVAALIGVACWKLNDGQQLSFVYYQF